MHNEFTAVFERDGDWYVAYCPEIPGANGQGRTKEDARENLAEAIALILEDRREDDTGAYSSEKAAPTLFGPTPELVPLKRFRATPRFPITSRGRFSEI